jgi:hypothetical protein
MDDIHNMCNHAHSQEELDEWKERWEWRQMKQQIAKQDKLYSYMEMMLEEYYDAETGINVVSMVDWG